MKNKLIIFVMTLFLVTPLCAQQIVWEETFEPDPGTWTLDSNWSIHNGYLELSWTPPIASYDLSATSPSINLPSGVEDLIVTQFVDDYPGNDGEVASIELVHDGDTTVLWSFDMTGSDWGYSGGKDINFSLAPYEGQEVQIKFRSYGGTTHNFNSWYIFNVAIKAYLNHDLAATNITGNDVLNIGQQGQWNVTVKNTGINTEYEYEIKLIREPGVVFGTTIATTPLDPEQERVFSFNWTPDISERVNLYGQVSFAEDEFMSNNCTNAFRVNIVPDDPINILVWDNDNSTSINGIGTQFFLEEALTANNVSYDTYTYLPADLTSFDAIFVALGIHISGG